MAMDETIYNLEIDGATRKKNVGLTIIIIGMIPILFFILRVSHVSGDDVMFGGVILVLIPVIFICLGAYLFYDSTQKIKILKNTHDNYEKKYSVKAISHPSSQLDSQSQTGEKFCPFCGTNNPADYNYCAQCQKPLLERKV